MKKRLGFKNITDYKKNFEVNKKKINLLVFPSNNDVSLEICNSLKYSHHVNLIKLDSEDLLDSAQYDSKSSNKWECIFSKLKDFVDAQEIDLIFFTTHKIKEQIYKHDFLKPYILNNDVSSLENIYKIRKFFEMIKPTKWAPKLIKKNFPKDDGQGITALTCDGRSFLVKDEVDANALLSTYGFDNIVFTEFLYKDRIYIDCFTDKDNDLIWIGSRQNERTSSGKVCSVTLKREFKEIANILNKSFPLRGYWSFSIKRDQANDFKICSLTTILSPKLSLYRAQGVNIPLMIIQDYLNRKQTTIQKKFVKSINFSYQAKSSLNYYFDKVFVDMDGTLIIDGKVCPIVIAFIYQMIQENKKIILITRHKTSPATTLEKMSISKSLFDEIIHIQDGSLKSSYVTNQSIFIDNEFPERRNVSDFKKIPVLDVDMLELFITFR